MRLVSVAQMAASGGEGDAEGQPGGQDHQAVEDGHEQRPGEVVADGPVDDPPELVGPLAARRGDEAAGPGHEGLAVDHHGDGGDEDEGERLHATERGLGGPADGVVVDPARQLLDELLHLPRRVGVLEARADQGPRVRPLHRLGELGGEGLAWRMAGGASSRAMAANVPTSTVETRATAPVRVQWNVRRARTTRGSRAAASSRPTATLVIAEDAARNRAMTARTVSRAPTT
jgi:hypothetical protein